jgi:hypothetical protein
MATNPSSIQLPQGFVLDDHPASAPATPLIQRQPGPQTPVQAEGEVLSNENKRLNLTQGQAGMQNQRFNQNQGLRQEYNALPLTKNYQTVVQKLGSALNAPPGPQGDLDVLYAFATVMDPNSVVRESEQDMAKQTASLYQQLQQKYRSYLEGNGLPPEVRQGLIETMRHNTAVINNSYNQQRAQYEDLAKRNGFDPVEIVGPHLGSTMQPLEKQYIETHGGTPHDPNALNQPDTSQPSAGRFGDQFGTPGTEVQFKDEAPNTTRAQRFQQGLSEALSSKQLKTQDDVNSWVEQFNQQNGANFQINWRDPQTRKAIEAAKAGQKFGVERPVDPEVQAKIDEKLKNGNDSTSAAALVGAADPLQIGPRVGAAMSGVAESLGGKGSLSDRYNINLDANRGYLDQLSGDHRLAYGLGQLGGSFLLPVGEARTPAALAKVGAAYGGFAGAMQGDSSTSLTQRVANTMTGAAAGGAVGYAIPKGIQVGGRLMGGRGATAVPELVDPVTGELNQPMDAMSPAERVAQFKANGFDQVTPAMAGGRSARVIEQGFNNLPGSAGVMEDVNSAVSGQARSAMTNVADQFGSSRTFNEAGTELQRGAKEWMGRADQVATKAYDAIPINPKAGATLDSTRAKLKDMLNIFQSNVKMKQLFENSRLKTYLGALTPDIVEVEKSGPTAGLERFLGVPAERLEKGGKLSWEDLKHFRSIIGEDLGEQRLGGDSPYKSQLNALYGALSEDMRATAQAQGPKALRAFERANNLYRAKEQRIEGALTRILGPTSQQTPESASAAIQAMTKGGKSTGDLKTLAEIKASTVKSGAWDEIASTLIRLGGQPANSEGRAFNPQTFVNWYSDMAEPARRLLFKPELRKALDGFVGVSQQLSRVKGMTNTSNTTPTMIGSGLVAAGGVAAVSHPMALLPLIGGGIANNLMARLWTSPKFVNWASGYSRAVANGNGAAASARIGMLPKLAATNPELSEPLAALQRSLVGVNDNLVPKVAASSNPDQETQQQ